MSENGAFTAAITTKKMKTPSEILHCRAFAGTAVIEVARSSRDPARWSPVEVFCNMSHLGANTQRMLSHEKIANCSRTGIEAAPNVPPDQTARDQAADKQSPRRRVLHPGPCANLKKEGSPWALGVSMAFSHEGRVATCRNVSNCYPAGPWSLGDP